MNEAATETNKIYYIPVMFENNSLVTYSGFISVVVIKYCDEE